MLLGKGGLGPKSVKNCRLETDAIRSVLKIFKLLCGRQIEKGASVDAGRTVRRRGWNAIHLKSLGDGSERKGEDGCLEEQQFSSLELALGGPRHSYLMVVSGSNDATITTPLSDNPSPFSLLCNCFSINMLVVLRHITAFVGKQNRT